MKIIAERLRGLRGERSQQQVEIQTQVKQNTVSRWERGQLPEAFEGVRQLAQYYRVSADYILGLTDDPAPLAESSLDAEQRAVLALFDALSDDEKEKVLWFLESLAGRGSGGFRLVE